jgi:hypothetical protein
MKKFFSKAMASLSLALSLGLVAAGSAQATPVALGNLNDGLNHTSFSTGWWSLLVNAGDVVTVTARRLDDTDLIATAFDGANGAGNQVGSGDDQLPSFSGLGDYGDPQFTFTALTAGEYSVGVFEWGTGNAEDLARNYFVSAVGATTNNVPEPGSIALLGLGLFGIAASRKRKQA